MDINIGTRKEREDAYRELSEENRQELREVFNMFDTDGSGDISTKELLAAMKALGFTSMRLADCKRLMNIIDENGDESINFEEFCGFMAFKLKDRKIRDDVEVSWPTSMPTYSRRNASQTSPMRMATSRRRACTP
jgi:Ca2+-binding EF-hand superfamily protein